MLAGAYQLSPPRAILPILISIVTVFLAFLTDKNSDPLIKKVYTLSLLGLFIGVAFGSFYGVSLRLAEDLTTTA